MTAISGPLAGTHLELFPALLTTWGEWRRLHPMTLVLEPMPGYAARLPQVNQQLNAGVLGLSGPAPRGAFGHDDRLAARATVVGLETAGAAKAYRTAALRQAGVVNDEVGGAAILVVDQAASDTITAFEAVANGRRLHFAAAYDEAHHVVQKAGNAVLVIGKEDWPAPIPLREIGRGEVGAVALAPFRL